VSFAQTVVLAAFAGGTIFLGLPVAKLRGLSRGAQAALTTAAGGVILFLIYDVLSQAVEPVDTALKAARAGNSPSDFVLYAGVLGGSLAVGLLSVTYLSGRMTARLGGPVQQAAASLAPEQIAMGTAIGLGLHNFSEGLAIGASAAAGATTFATLLVIGFALHNATEGFAIAAPMSQIGQGAGPSWNFLGVAGLIGGGPTFAGGVVGYAINSPLLSILFLGFAAGALIYVFNETMAASRRLAVPMVTAAALAVGLLAAFGTDFLLTAAGA
jgi:ZIP family zinc transporter